MNAFPVYVDDADWVTAQQKKNRFFPIYADICDLAERVRNQWPLNCFAAYDPAGGRLATSDDARRVADRVVELLNHAIDLGPGKGLPCDARRALGGLYGELVNVFVRGAKAWPLDRNTPGDPGKGDLYSSGPARLAVCKFAHLLRWRYSELSWVADALDGAEELERLTDFKERLATREELEVELEVVHALWDLAHLVAKADRELQSTPRSVFENHVLVSYLGPSARIERVHLLYFPLDIPSPTDPAETRPGCWRVWPANSFTDPEGHAVVRFHGFMLDQRLGREIHHFPMIRLAPMVFALPDGWEHGALLTEVVPGGMLQYRSLGSSGMPKLPPEYGVGGFRPASVPDGTEPTPPECEEILKRLRELSPAALEDTLRTYRG